MLRLTQFLTLAILIFIAHKTFFAPNTPTIEPTKKETITPIVEQKTAAITALESPSFEKTTVAKKVIVQEVIQPVKVDIQPAVDHTIYCTFGKHFTYDTIPRAIAKEYLQLARPIERLRKEEPVVVEVVEEEVVNSEEIFNTPKTIECRVFPNPATEYITVELSDVAEANMTLMSSNGQMVWTGLTQDQTTVLNLQDYPAGVYFLQVVTEGQNMVKSIVIQ